MSDITRTAAQVKARDGSTQMIQSTAGEAFGSDPEGLLVYRSAADGRWMLLDVDDSGRMADISSHVQSIGMVMHGGVAEDDQVWVAVGGPVQFATGSVFTPGLGYYGSANAGGLRPASDNTTDDVPVFIGSALTAGELDLAPANHREALA